MKSSRLLKSLKLRGVYYLCTVKTKINTPLMYEVLDKDTIKSAILPFLSVAKHGYVTKSDLVEVIQCIPFVQIAIFTVYARRIRLHQRLD